MAEKQKSADACCTCSEQIKVTPSLVQKFNEYCKKRKPKRRLEKLFKNSKKCATCGLLEIKDINYAIELACEDICRCEMYGCQKIDKKKAGCCKKKSTTDTSEREKKESKCKNKSKGKSKCKSKCKSKIKITCDNNTSTTDSRFTTFSNLTNLSHGQYQCVKKTCMTTCLSTEANNAPTYCTCVMGQNSYTRDCCDRTTCPGYSPATSTSTFSLLKLQDKDVSAQLCKCAQAQNRSLQYNREEGTEDIKCACCTSPEIENPINNQYEYTENRSSGGNSQRQSQSFRYSNKADSTERFGSMTNQSRQSKPSKYSREQSAENRSSMVNTQRQSRSSKYGKEEIAERMSSTVNSQRQSKTPAYVIEATADNISFTDNPQRQSNSPTYNTESSTERLSSMVNPQRQSKQPAYIIQSSVDDMSSMVNSQRQSNSPTYNIEPGSERTSSMVNSQRQSNSPTYTIESGTERMGSVNNSQRPSRSTRSTTNQDSATSPQTQGMQLRYFPPVPFARRCFCNHW